MSSASKFQQIKSMELITNYNSPRDYTLYDEYFFYSHYDEYLVVLYLLLCEGILKGR